MNQRLKGKNFEDSPSKNQNLTFEEVENFIKLKNYKVEKDKLFDLFKKDDSKFTNLALLFSDQNPFDIYLSGFSDHNFIDATFRKEFKGSVLKQLCDIFHFFSSELQNSTKYFKDLEYEKLDYPKNLIGEIVVNAIAHRDYSFYGPILINISQENLSVTSLGSVDEDNHLSSISVYRNPKLIKIFCDLNLMSANSTGLMKVFQIYKSITNKPEIRLSPNVFQIILPNRSINKQINYPDLFKEECPNKNIKVTPSKKIILDLLMENGILSSSEIIKKSELKQSTFYKCLNQLLKDGLITYRYYGKRLFRLTFLGLESCYLSMINNC